LATGVAHHAECARRRDSFAFETTLAGLSHRGDIKRWPALGYHVSLFFLSLLLEWGENQ
jgi:predicted ABC-type ATPase